MISKTYLQTLSLRYKNQKSSEIQPMNQTEPWDAMEDLMDLLTYTCPFTGAKRVAGGENGPLDMKHLGCNPTTLQLNMQFLLGPYGHPVFQDLGNRSLNIQKLKGNSHPCWMMMMIISETTSIEAVLPRSSSQQRCPLQLSSNM